MYGFLPGCCVNCNLETQSITHSGSQLTQSLISFSSFVLPLRTYAAQLSSYRSHCDSILNQVEAALCQLEDLKQKHLLVSTKTGALHEACEQLLQDQVLWNSYYREVITINYVGSGLELGLHPEWHSAT